MIKFATREEDIERCYPVMAQLRPHIARDEFVERIRRQERESSYRMLLLEDGEEIRAVAGIRISESLAWGKFLYVDDLVTDANSRSRGHGDRLFDWIVEYARAEGCAQMHLDSGVQRFEAHRFYLRKRMRIASHHFSILFSDGK